MYFVKKKNPQCIKHVYLSLKLHMIEILNWLLLLLLFIYKLQIYEISVCKTSYYMTLLLTSMPFLSSIGLHLLRWITICKLNLNEVRLKNYLKFLTNQSIRDIYTYNLAMHAWKLIHENLWISIWIYFGFGIYPDSYLPIFWSFNYIYILQYNGQIILSF